MSIVTEESLEDTLKEDEVFGDMSTDEETSVEVLDALEETVTEMPEKFKGKSAADIATSYMELEKDKGRLANEVGDLRKLTDDFLKQKLEPVTETKENQIDLDNLLENPNDVIKGAIDNNPRIAALEEQLRQAQVAEKKQGFETKHTDWNTVLNSEDFSNWVQGSAGG